MVANARRGKKPIELKTPRGESSEGETSGAPGTARIDLASYVLMLMIIPMGKNTDDRFLTVSCSELLETVKSMHSRNKMRSPTVSSFSSCLPSALQSSNSIKLEHLDFQTLQVMPGGKLAIPVTMASLSADVGDDEESRTGSSVQSYRFLEDVCEQTEEQETYTIAGDSETNPSSTVFTMNGILADSLVIHTLKQVGRERCLFRFFTWPLSSILDHCLNWNGFLASFFP